MLCSGRTLLRSVDSVPRAFAPVRYCNAGGQSEIGVRIPKRIEREPTDILTALASTVQRDVTAYPYKYPDDPFFYPYTYALRRNYALSLESGRKSARWIVENNPGFFKNQLSDPPIQAFLPKFKIEELSEITEETLQETIERREVVNSITVYNKLLNKGTIIPNDIKQSLLELVCFYNSDERPNEEELEMKWFENIEFDKLDVNTWKEQSFAEALFQSMDPNCPLATSTIIQGMIKYNNVQKAIEIYTDAKSKNMKFSLEVYNALLSQANNKSIDVPGGGVPFIDSLLKEMASENITPNIYTLNAALKSLQYLYSDIRKNSYPMKLIMEFVHLGIYPSLGTYHYLFQIYGHTKLVARRHKELLQSLLEVISHTRHDLRHPSDFNFFPQAMHLFSYVLGDNNLCTSLNDILLQGDNMKFFKNSASESEYFRNYFLSLFHREPLEIAMEKFKEIVPTLYCPEIRVLMVALSAIGANNATEHLVPFWKDLKEMDCSRIWDILKKVLSLVNIFTEKAALDVICEAAILAREYHKENGLDRAGQESCSLILMALLRGGDETNALEVFNELKDMKGAMSLFDAAAIKELFLYAIYTEKASILLECLRYAEEESYLDVLEMAETAVPFLGERDKPWASELASKAKKSKEAMESIDEES